MDNTFSGSGGLRNTRKFSKAGRGFSPSFGVRQGLIHDPHWPAPLSENEGASPRRRHLRVPTTFEVQGADLHLKVQGDLSVGGAKFFAPMRIEEDQVTIVAGDKLIRVKGEIIRRAPNGNGYVHHVRFQPSQPSEEMERLIAKLAE